MKHTYPSILPLLLSIFLWNCSGEQQDGIEPFPYDEAEAIVQNIEQTQRSGPETDLRSFSGKDPDEVGTHDFRAVIQKAIDSLHASGGGTLVFSHTESRGSWMKQQLTYRIKGPIELRSNVHLLLEPNIRLYFAFSPDDYLPGGKGVLRRYEGTTLYSYSPLIRAFNAENISVTFSGGQGSLPVIDGDGWKWQKWSGEGDQRVRERGDIPAYKHIRTSLNNKDVPIAERICTDPDYHFLRPTMMEFFHCNRVKVEGLKLVNSPFWLVHPVFTRNMVFRHCMFDAQVVNNDGIDIESSSDVLVENIIFDNHDDNVVIKSGRDLEGRKGALVAGTELEGLDSPYIREGRITAPTQNVVVRNCVLKGHYGFCIGSESSGGAKNIYLSNCFAPMEVKMAVYMKSGRERGGVIENIHVTGLELNKVEADVICLIPNYDNDTISPYPPLFRDIHISHITAREAQKGIRIFGWPDAPIKKVSLHDIKVDSIRSENPGDLLLVRQAEDIMVQNVMINGHHFEGVYDHHEPGLLPPKQH